MKKIFYLLVATFMIQGCYMSRHSSIDSIDVAKKVILKEEGNEQFFYWELKNEKFLWGNGLSEVTALDEYRDSLKMVLGVQKYKLAVKEESAENEEESLMANEENGDRINALLVHTGRIGKIRKINYLEAQILNYQMERYPMFSRPTEFHGFIIENKQKGMIRVYFGASDTEWPPRPTILIKEVEKELKQGWKLIGHLHNHYCKEDKNYVGILAPSLADAQYYKMLKERFLVKKALITNGFHTVEIENKDFEKFESH